MAEEGHARMRRDRVDVTVPARLHLGLLDLHGGLGRRFGSLGLTLDGPRTRLSATAGSGLSAVGPDAERAERTTAAKRLYADKYSRDAYVAKMRQLLARIA